MPVAWLTIFKTPAEWLSKQISKSVGEKIARHEAGYRARYEDLTKQTSLPNLVRIELDKLAASTRLPKEFQTDVFRNWLRQSDNTEIFVEVLIVRAGNISGLPTQGQEQLATELESIIGITREHAFGLVSWIVSDVHGQLKATESGKRSLELALAEWTAARIHSLSHPEQRQFPCDADLARVRAMAETLLEAGKRSWKMPRFVAPLTLEAYVRQEDREKHPTNSSELSSIIEAGESLVLFGDGGIGKTTFLLELCRSSFNGKRRIPLFVDAAVWGRTNATLFEYLAIQPSAHANGVTSAELTKLAEAGHLVIMLNGWNEMMASSKLVCRDGLIQLTTAAEALSIVVVSRSSSDVPSLPKAKQVEVRGLTWEGQAAVVRAELGNDGAAAAALLDLLAKDTRLRHAARSPLILRGLIAQTRKGAMTSSSVFDLLGAAVQAFEEDDQRNLVLSDSPVDGHQCAYLEELACLLTQRLSTDCSRNDALQAIHTAATLLAERQLIGAIPKLTSVLEVLASHHLLHLDNGVVRFAHQRFQEYFSATRLLRECLEDGVPPTLLRTAAIHPAWGESLILVAGKLKHDGSPSTARVRLVKSAAAIDLGVGCDLAGICALSEADDPELHLHLVARVNELAQSPLIEVRDLGVAYQIASGFPAFSTKLWSLIESEDQQTRLHTYRLNGTAMSLAQLGIEAEHRVTSWPSERQAEFVHEIAGNVDNYEFLVGLARGAPDPAVQTAAISALFWNFPASDVPMQAWLDAPVDVQTEYDLVTYIQHALEQKYAGDPVRMRLQSIAIGDVPDNARLRFVLAFPNEVGPRALDLVFEYLRSKECHGDNAPLVAIAKTHSPQRFLELVKELASQARGAPKWLDEYLNEAPPDVKADIFERALNALQGQDIQNLSGEILGPLANHSQIERSVALWLGYSEVGHAALTEVDREKHRQLGHLLSHAPGDDLLKVVMQSGQAAPFAKAIQLVDLILRRIGRDEGSVRTANLWLPTIDDVRQLIELFGQKAETAEIPQDTVSVYLCCIASNVAPAEFGSFLLDTCRRHLDAWSIFQEKLNQWSKRATSDRPHNPQFGLYLTSALVRWGPDALPGLLALMAHPSAMKFVPEAVARVASVPWVSRQKRLFSSVSTDIQQGEERRRLGREFRQPDDAFQHWTDEAANTLGQQLSEMVAAYQEKKATGEKRNAQEAEYRVGSLTSVVAGIPSAGAIDPVYRALESGLMNVNGAVGALRGLVRQGLCISDATVVGHLEALYERASEEKWHDDSSRCAMSELSELLLCVEPISLLSKPTSHYIEQWARFSYPNEISRHLGAMHSQAAWPALIELGNKHEEKGAAQEELASALVSALKPEHLPEFLGLVADGTLFTWCRSEWTLERLAPYVASVLGEEPGQRQAFLGACRQAKCPLADAFADDVLSHIKGSEEARQSFLLEALDAGRAVHWNMPAYRKLKEMFTLKVPVSDAQYNVTPKASNALRTQLYTRAKDVGPVAESCRRLLASIERERREDGRPDNEPRHPAPDDGLAWTDALLGV
jgi:hypothetical protein